MPNEIVVSNTTPIITLSRIGHLWLLKSIYESIYIPQAVFDEIMMKHDEVSIEVKKSSHEWINVRRIEKVKIKRMFSSSLHSGEIEAIMLAEEMDADTIIIDDFLARKYALQAGLNLTGTLGILLKAKRIRLINEIKPLLDEIISKGIFINQKLYEDMLELAGES